METRVLTLEYENAEVGHDAGRRSEKDARTHTCGGIARARRVAGAVRYSPACTPAVCYSGGRRWPASSLPSGGRAVTRSGRTVTLVFFISGKSRGARMLSTPTGPAGSSRD